MSNFSESTELSAALPPSMTEAALEQLAQKYAMTRCARMGDRLSVKFYGTKDNFFNAVKQSFLLYAQARTEIEPAPIATVRSGLRPRPPGL